MADDDAKKWLSCLGWGCLAVVVIAALGIGGCVAFVYQGGKGAHTVAEAYLEAVDAGRYEEAFGRLGPGFADGIELTDFVAFEQEARAELGSCGSWRARGTGFDRRNGRSTSTLRYVGDCDSGAVTVSFRLEKINGVWLIQDIRYNEELGAEPPTVVGCASCGRAAPPGAKFCPYCGAALQGGAATPNDSRADAQEAAE